MAVISQSARLYLERKGLRTPRSTLHRPVLDIASNVATRPRAILLPEFQLEAENGGSPDRAGRASAWPGQEPQSVPPA